MRNGYFALVVSMLLIYPLFGCASNSPTEDAPESIHDADGRITGDNLKNLVVNNGRSLYPSLYRNVSIKISPTKDENSESGIIVPWDKASAINEFNKMMPRSYVRSLRIIKVLDASMCESKNSDEDDYVIAWIKDNWINRDLLKNLARSYDIDPIGELYRDLLARKIVLSVCESNKK